MKHTDKSLLKMNNLTESIYKKYRLTESIDIMDNESYKLNEDSNNKILYDIEDEITNQYKTQLGEPNKPRYEDKPQKLEDRIQLTLILDSYEAKHLKLASIKKALSKYGTVKQSTFSHPRLTGGDKEVTFQIFAATDSKLNEKYSEELDEDYGEDKYSLVGQDGNAFALMGYTARCMKECGLRNEIDEMRQRATESNYDNLIRVCDEYVQRCNDIARDGFEESLDE